jgi:hypothetical protein
VKNLRSNPFPHQGYINELSEFAVVRELPKLAQLPQVTWRLPG